MATKRKRRPPIQSTLTAAALHEFAALFEALGDGLSATQCRLLAQRIDAYRQCGELA